MNGPAWRILTAALVVFSTLSIAYAQAVYQPTRAPIVTAERTEWYLAGEPITFYGNVYYPAGAAVSFNGFEMVRSGSYRGVPLYTRTTLEPYSVMFVPLSGGWMQPYERLRDRELAGTAGSTPLPFTVLARTDTAAGMMPQAAGPPMLVGSIVEPEPRTAPVVEAARSAPEAVGTAGRVVPSATSGRPYEPLIKPLGLDAAYVDFGGKRYFPKGKAVSLEGLALKRIGDHHGFPVYVSSADPTTIYITVMRGAGSLAAPFSSRR